jgi:hypothetical protein
VRATTVLLTHPLADAQPMYELRPSVEDGLLTLLLLLLRRGMLCLPVRLLKRAATTMSEVTRLKSKRALTSRIMSSFSATTTIPEITGYAFPFLNSKLVCARACGKIAAANFGGHYGVRTTASA